MQVREGIQRLTPQAMETMLIPLNTHHIPDSFNGILSRLGNATSLVGTVFVVMPVVLVNSLASGIVFSMMVYDVFASYGCLPDIGCDGSRTCIENAGPLFHGFLGAGLFAGMAAGLVLANEVISQSLISQEKHCAKDIHKKAIRCLSSILGNNVRKSDRIRLEGLFNTTIAELHEVRTNPAKRQKLEDFRSGARVIVVNASRG